MYFEWSPDPVLISLGSLAIRWYGLMFACGFLIGFYLLQSFFKKEGKSPADVDSILNYMVIGTLLGARLGHCLFYEPGYYLSNPLEIIKFWKGGLASHGGALGIFIALYLYSRKHPDQSYLWLLSRVSVPVALGGMFIRIGNFFNSEIVGIASSLPIAVIFSRLDQIPRHPTQLYEAISYLVIFLILYFIYLRSAGKILPGRLFGSFLLMLFSARFFIEFTKVPQASFSADLPLRMGQLLSIPLILLGLYLLIVSFKNKTWKEQDQD